jgi:hypothetical protein
MSSALRDFSERQSNTMFSRDGVYFNTYAKIVEVANSYNAQQQGNIFLFPNEIDCANFVYDLSDYADNNNGVTNGNETFTDMGKQIKFGVKGALSDHFTMRLVQLRTLNYYEGSFDGPFTIGADYNTFWVLTDAKLTTGMKNVFGVTDYGQIFIQR